MSEFQEILQRLPADQVLVRGDGWRVDCRSFFAQAARAALEVDRLALDPGARVGVYARNSLAYLFLLWALWARGFVAVLINRRWPTAQASELLGLLECQAVFTECAADWGPVIRGIPVRPMPPVVHGQLVGQAVAELQPLPLPDMDRPATILFTTGSTGVPKAVEHRLESHFLNAAGSNENLPFGPGDTWLASLAFFHVGGLAILFRALLGGGALRLCDRPEPALRKRTDLTHISVVPTQLMRWCLEPELVARLKCLKAILLGGAPSPASLIGECIALGLPLYTTYGSSEMGSQITTTALHDSAEHWYTSGRLLRHRRLKIDDAGCVWVGGETLFSRILSLDRGVIDQPAPEWYRTGDLGFLDEAGYLHLLGREDNMFISGGENISPEEVESAIMELPGVIEALVVPVPDEEFGHRPAAFVRFYRGIPIDLPALCARLKEKIARFKVPDYCLPWPDEPPMRGGKLDRHSFRSLALQLIEAQGLRR